MRRRLIIVMTALLPAAGAVAQRVSHVARQGGDYVISYEFALPVPRSDYSYTLTPVICGSGDTLRLAPVTVRGRLNALKLRRREVLAGGSARSSSDATYVKAGSVKAGDSIVSRSVTVSSAVYPWLTHGSLRLCLLREGEGCCNVEAEPMVCGDVFRCMPALAVAPVKDNTGVAGALEESNPVLSHISDYRPYDNTRILRKERGALYVHFPLNKTLLMHDFRNNAATLDRIVDITRQIMSDSTSSVRIIQIIGLASPEGSVETNSRLARERAEALKRYVQQRVHTPDSLYDVANGGEAWTELRSQIEDSDVEWRDEMLAIIDGESDLNRREQRLRSLCGGKPYAYLRDNMLSDQRNSGYVRIFYEYVPDEAAASINRASQLIAAERYTEALDLLRPVAGDIRAQNALGVALFMTGCEQEAISCFRRAARNGNSEAVENIVRLGLGD